MHYLSEPETKKKYVAFRDAIYCDPARLDTGENFNSCHFTPDLWINVFRWCVGWGSLEAAVDKVSLSPWGPPFNTGILDLTQMISRNCLDYILIIILCFLIKARPDFYCVINGATWPLSQVHYLVFSFLILSANQTMIVLYSGTRSCALCISHALLINAICTCRARCGLLKSRRGQEK